ncbi:MAG: GTPase HflX [Bowdeniella nasicola]|nr:GTPase HflX [Bowdeniella nasicola]
MTGTTSGEDERMDAVVARVLARSAAALQHAPTAESDNDGEQLAREERAALRRVAGLSTELEDVREVEYRQLRLERVILVAVWTSGTLTGAENSLRELAALAETAGSQVLDGVLQRRNHPDPATYLGSGKARELADLVAQLGADTVIVDDELSPSQRRGLEDVVQVKVVDRTAVILDIFAQHAQSKEGKAQVELAQLEYLLPRLRGWGESMSRQAGGRAAGGAGIGSRGPGETQIELDRRRIRTRMAKLRREIANMVPARETKRSQRRAGHTPSVAIAGYTNAGKSSLLNRLTDAGVLVENQLFATLDPTVRRAQTPDGRDYTLTDTVGFVRNLPHQLVEAFRSTLEEVAEADVIVHVFDAAHPDPLAQVEAVNDVIADIEGADSIPQLLVANKVDLADSLTLVTLRTQLPGVVLVSAKTGVGMDELRAKIADALPQPNVPIDVVVPYTRGDLVAQMHEYGDINTLEHHADGTHISGHAYADLAHELTEVDVAK